MLNYFKKNPISTVAVAIFILIGYGLAEVPEYNGRVLSGVIIAWWVVCSMILGSWLGQDYHRKKTAGKL
jgi:phosphate/sulfate permease